jgi:transcriptional regulator of aromatic amino acid metabolism
MAGSSQQAAFVSALDADLEYVRMRQSNLLVIGPATATDRVVDQLRPGFAPPVLTWHEGEAFDLPSRSEVSTLILHEVEALTPADQQRLLEWHDQQARRIQIISTAQAPLFPLVEAGEFDECLYYRLNTVCVKTDGPERL